MPDTQTPVPEGLYQRIVEDAPDAIIFADREGTIRLWNAGAEAVLGYRADEAVGGSLDLIIPEKQRVGHWEGYRRVMATGATRYGRGELLRVPAIRKDGRRISIEFSILLPRDPAGEVLGAAAILRDVTERWEQDRALRQRLAALEGARSQDELDLRTHVTKALHYVIDPELGLDVVELGLVYGVEVQGSVVRIDLTMTTPACPLGEHIVQDAEARIRALAGVSEVEVRLVWDPPWSPERMTASARKTLGWGT